METKVEFLIYLDGEDDLWGWCHGECELAFLVEKLEDEGHQVKVVPCD